VAYFTTMEGWLGQGIACSRPVEARRILQLETAREQLGDDPRLVALATRFARTEPEAWYPRVVLAAAARTLVNR
jgi:hypothetical protein